MKKRPPTEGPAVFFPHNPDKGKLGAVPVGGKLLKVRLPSDPPIRDRLNQYGKPRGDK